MSAGAPTLGGLFRILRGRSGTFTVNGATPVVVANRFVTANSVIESTLKTLGGTQGAKSVTATTPGTSFTVTGTAGDTSVYNYIILL